MLGLAPVSTLLLGIFGILSTLQKRLHIALCACALIYCLI